MKAFQSSTSFHRGHSWAVRATNAHSAGTGNLAHISAKLEASIHVKHPEVSQAHIGRNKVRNKNQHVTWHIYLVSAHERT